MMYARAVDEAGSRLRELHRRQWEDLGLGAVALVLALAAAHVRPALAVPLLVGALGVGALGLRALWRRWDLVDRLAEERDAYAIPEVLAYARREASLERRRCVAASIRTRLAAGGPCAAGPVAAELEALASDLEDVGLALEPACAVACRRLVSDAHPPPEDVRALVRRIRGGFTPLSGGAAFPSTTLLLAPRRPRDA
jgi:hypothetical protein